MQSSKMKKFAILFFLVTTPFTYGGIIPIEEYSETLWNASGFSKDYDVTFRSCEELNAGQREDAPWPYEFADKWQYYKIHLREEVQAKNRIGKRDCGVPKGKGLKKLKQMLPSKTPPRRPKPRFCLVGGKNIREEEWNRPFIKTFTDLLDFYNPYEKFESPPFEEELIKKFLDSFIDSQIGRKLNNMIMAEDPDEWKDYNLFATLKGMAKHFIQTWKELLLHKHEEGFVPPLSGPQYKKLFERLKLMWFGNTTFRASERIVGFRHVFVGERDDVQRFYGDVTVLRGLNNWYQFYRTLCIKENIRMKKGEFNFRYEVLPLPRQFFGVNPQPQEVKFCRVALNWNDAEKESFNTILFGSRPEFDFAIFSLCFHEYVNDNVANQKKTDKISGLCASHLGNGKAPVQVEGDLNEYEYYKVGGSRLRNAFFRV